MSRIGKQPIPIPKGVEVKLEGNSITVKGPKGRLERQIHPKVQVEIKSGDVILSVAEQTREVRSFHGLFRALIANMVTGVTNGFEKNLEITG